MAVKDHTLDDKIIRAAKSEFLKHGYQKASLHKIVEVAGITTGALYTRYKNKDELFCSLIIPALQEIAAKAGPLTEGYMKAQNTGNAEAIISAIRSESRFYLDLLFEHYDECVLLFCKSEGSSIRENLDRMMEQKSRQTVEYLKSISHREVDFDGVEFIMSEQFHYYRKILQKGYTKEKALSCMETVEEFLEAGWKSLFEKILS